MESIKVMLGDVVALMVTQNSIDIYDVSGDGVMRYRCSLTVTPDDAIKLIRAIAKQCID